MHREIDAFLESEWLAGLRHAFARADRDDDGSVDATDLMELLGGYGLYVGEDWAARQIARFDQNGDGRATFADYVAGMVMAAAHEEPAAAALRLAFTEADADGDGRISLYELAELFRGRGQSLSLPELADRVHAWDHDGDGQMDLGELVRMLLG